MNVVSLMGRLAADPELRHTQTGIPVTSFRIAVQRAYKSQDGQQQVDWINIVAWRGTAEFVSRYFKKGAMIALKGAIQTRQYTDKDGSNRNAFEVIADNVYFTGSRQETGTADGKGFSSPYDSQIPENEDSPAFSTAGADDFEEIVGDDELPF